METPRANRAGLMLSGSNHMTQAETVATVSVVLISAPIESAAWVTVWAALVFARLAGENANEHHLIERAGHLEGAPPAILQQIAVHGAALPAGAARAVIGAAQLGVLAGQGMAISGSVASVAPAVV